MAITGILLIVLGSYGAYKYLEGKTSIPNMLMSVLAMVIGVVLIVVSIF